MPLNAPLSRKPKTAWTPTKAEKYRRRWRATRKGAVASRIMADLQIAGYEAALKAHARGRLVDLGCGNAPFTGIYSSLVTKFVWADWPNSPHQLFELDVETDLNRPPLPFEDAAFDTILLSDVLEHIAEPDLLFAELARVLSPGGRLIVGVPFCYAIHEQPYDFYRYTRYKLQHFGEKHGLSVVELHEIGGGFDVLSDVASKLLGGIWSPLARLPYYAWKVFNSLPLARALNARAAEKLPLAYLAVYAARA